MNPSFLLPHRFKLLGWVLFIPSLILGIFWKFKEFELSFLNLKMSAKQYSGKGTSGSTFNVSENSALNFTDEVALTGMVVGLLFIAFAKEKHEDEFISRTRLVSLQWAVLINYTLLIIASWFIHGLAFLDVMLYNMLTVLLLFVMRFHIVLTRFRKSDNSIPAL